MRTFEIAGRAVGRDEPPYVIAEAGVHHQNDVELAFRYVEAARDAGADAVKFQTYSADRLATRWAPLYWTSEEGAGSRVDGQDCVRPREPGAAEESARERTGDNERTQHEVFAERALLSEEEYALLAAHAESVGITFLSTPFDEDAAAMLDRLGVPAFKIASADITHLPLLRRVASFGKPVLLSTGASTMEEVAGAVKILEGAEVSYALLHCSLSYPTQLSDANLRRLEALAEAFPTAVLGYSDHTLPEETELACPLAVGLGASIIEKHFTLDRSLPGDDHYHSVDPAGLGRLVRACREAAAMTPPPEEMRPCERPARENARRSVVARRDLAAGKEIRTEDLDFKRPGTGLSPARMDLVLGRRLKRAKKRDEFIRPEDVE